MASLQFPYLPTLLEEFREKMADFSEGIPRDISFPNIPNKIMVAIGMRRTGKTYYLFQTIKKLLQTVPITRILYINFEDDRILPANHETVRDLIDGFYALYPENHDQECYLFFDEIQNVDQWHMVIRRYFDTKKVKIYLTGSSAKLLSKEIATSLRGRSVAIEVWPFSFREIMKSQHEDFNQLLSKPIGKVALDKLREHLLVYLKQGGFPETLNLAMEDRNFILQDYVSTVIFRDIIERYKITNVTLVRQLIKALIKNVGASLSAHKLYNDMRSQGFSVAKNTIHDYLDHITDAYLAFRVPLYAESLRKTESNPKKIYAIDTGLIKAYTAGFAENIGHYFENLVYLDLRRRGHDIYYYLTKSRLEIDFLSKDRLGQWHINQVCWSLDDPKTQEREERALEEAQKELGIQGVIITPESYLTSFL